MSVSCLLAKPFSPRSGTMPTGAGSGAYNAFERFERLPSLLLPHEIPRVEYRVEDFAIYYARWLAGAAVILLIVHVVLTWL